MTTAIAARPPILDFRAEDHTYWRDGKLVPNVTRVLSLIQSFDHIDPAVLANAQQEGTDIHRTVELHVKGDLAEASLPAWLRPRLDAFKRFEAESGFVMIASECRVYNPQSNYAGTLDLIGKLRMPQSRSAIQITACIDLKRTILPGNRAVGLQTAAYAAAWNGSACVPQVTHRFALQLRENGTYRLQPYVDRSDFANFTACLLVWRLRGAMQ